AGQNNLIGCAGPRRTKASGIAFGADRDRVGGRTTRIPDGEDWGAIGAVPGRIENERPYTEDIRDRVVTRVRVITVAGGAGRKRVIHVRALDDVDRPSSPGSRHGDDVILLVAVVHTHAEELEKFAGIVFVGY